MPRLTHAARSAAIAVGLALIMAAPAAAAQPSRELWTLESFVFPAGTACAFDVEGAPSRGFIAHTTFSDGTVQNSVQAHGAYVNLETLASFPTNDTSRVLHRSDPATGIDVVVMNGANTWNFLPGDEGPYGTVTNPNGALYHVVGWATYTWDPNANRVTHFAYSGTITDVCAALT